MTRTENAISYGNAGSALVDLPYSPIPHKTQKQQALDERSLQTLFTSARTHYAWSAEQVHPELLKKLYELTRWGPTGMNVSPLRVTFVMSPEGKSRLLQSTFEGNKEKVTAAPITAILSYDTQFYEHLEKLVPFRSVKQGFVDNPARAEKTAEFNSHLQAGYFILGARSLGLDAGPIGGFDSALTDQVFYPDGRFKSFLLVNLGYGDPGELRPRAPRLEFEEACEIV